MQSFNSQEIVGDTAVLSFVSFDQIEYKGAFMKFESIQTGTKEYSAYRRKIFEANDEKKLKWLAEKGSFFHELKITDGGASLPKGLVFILMTFKGKQYLTNLSHTKDSTIIMQFDATQEDGIIVEFTDDKAFIKEEKQRLKTLLVAEKSLIETNADQAIAPQSNAATDQVMQEMTFGKPFKEYTVASKAEKKRDCFILNVIYETYYKGIYWCSDDENPKMYYGLIEFPRTQKEDVEQEDINQFCNQLENVKMSMHTKMLSNKHPGTYILGSQQ